MGSLLRVEGLEVEYHTRDGTLFAVRNANFAVDRGEIVGIVGESGCGKSTVASAVMRLLPPNGRIGAGRILLQGQDLVPLRRDQMRQIRGKTMSMIFQDPMTSLNPVFTVEQQMVDALRAHRKGQERSSRRALRAWAIEMLERVGIPDAARQIREYPHQFSGGMRQRIMIAMALLSNPALLVADEPTSALDVTLEAQIVDLIRGLRDELGTAILYITHDLGVVAQLCDRVLVMYAGNIVEAGATENLFARPHHPYTQALLRSHPTRSLHTARLRTIRGRVPSLKELPLGCKFGPRCDWACPLCQDTEPAVALVDGHEVLCHAYHPYWKGQQPDAAEATPEEGAGQEAGSKAKGGGARCHLALQRTAGGFAQDGEAVVEIQGLRTHFSDHVGLLGQVLGRRAGVVQAVAGIDIRLRRGETLALVGESGSGKTTLGRTLLRFVSPAEGKLVVDGQDITHLSQAEIRPLRARMQMIFQDPISSLSPRMKVSAILLEPFKIHGLPAGSEKVDELLAMVGLSAEQADKYPHQLSGGQARRVGIARALALRPEILVADEPTSGLDVSVAAGILNLLKDLRDQLHLAYILITHNLNIIHFIADRVAVMYLGKIVELAETERLFSQPRHPYTEALMSAIPVPDPGLRQKRQRIILKGEIPSPRHPPGGCPFHPRCRYAEARCATEAPSLQAVGDGGQWSACHYPERVQEAGF